MYFFLVEVLKRLFHVAEIWGILQNLGKGPLHLLFKVKLITSFNEKWKKSSLFNLGTFKC